MKAKVRMAKKVFVPMYHYSGNFQASWTSMVMHYKDAQRINYKGELENYREENPQYLNGNSSGYFVSIVSAIKLDLLNKHIYSYLENMNIMESLYSGVVQLDDNSEVFMPCDYSPDFAWKSVGESRAEHNAWSHSKYPGRTQSFSATFSNRNDSVFYIPCRIIEFDYDGKIYECVEVIDKLFYNFPIKEGYSGDAVNPNPDEDPGCGLAIGGIVAAVILTWFFWWLFELIGFEGDVRDNMGIITTWLIFFFAFLYFRKKDGLGDISSRFVKKEIFLLADLVVVVFLATGISYVCYYIGIFMGLSNYITLIVCSIFLLSCYLLYKFRLSEINRDNEEINAHNNKTNIVYDSYRKEKLKTSASFVWSWNTTETNEEKKQINKESKRDEANEKEISGKTNIKYCRHCGKELGNGYKFCSYCGEKQI